MRNAICPQVVAMISWAASTTRRWTFRNWRTSSTTMHRPATPRTSGNPSTPHRLRANCWTWLWKTNATQTGKRRERMWFEWFFIFGTIYRHSLPESPPDSSSEHPYSPQDGCEPPIAASTDAIYTNLTQTIYKPTILNPILADNLILGSHIVVTDQNNEQLIDNGGILQDGRLLVPNGAGLMNNRIIEGDGGMLQDRILTETTGELVITVLCWRKIVFYVKKRVWKDEFHCRGEWICGKADL